MIAYRSIETFTSSIFFLEDTSGHKKYFLKLLRQKANTAVEKAFDKELLFYKNLYQHFPTDITATLIEYSKSNSDHKYILLNDLSDSHESLEWPCPPTNPRAITAVKQLAKFHLCSLNDPASIKIAKSYNKNSEKLENPAKTMESFIEYLKDRIADEQIDKISTISNLVIPNNDFSCILFGDSHFWNVMYNKDEKSALLIDWQDWGIGSPINDLAYIVSLGVCPSIRDKNFRTRLFNAYLDQWEQLGGPQVDQKILWDEMIIIGLTRAVKTAVYQWGTGLNPMIWTRTLFTLVQLPEFKAIKV
jgi:hypothetical protein